MDLEGNFDVFSAKSVSIRSLEDINLRADNDVNIEAGRNLLLKAAADKIPVPDSGIPIETGAVGPPLVGDGGEIIIEAANDMTLTSVQGNLNTTVLLGNHDTTVTGSRTTTVVGNDDIVVTGSSTSTTTGALNVSATGGITVSTPGVSKIAGGREWGSLLRLCRRRAQWQPLRRKRRGMAPAGPKPHGSRFMEVLRPLSFLPPKVEHVRIC